MCGIVGFTGDGDKKTLKRMCDVISYRGPNDDGYFSDKNISLGMRRLSIIDVKGGKQPISNEDGSIVVVYNGEIFNYLDIKKGLAKKHRFRTASDTEVLVHLYEEHGVDFVSKLRGMFAFALWDSNKQRLVLGRDRLGKKPLYYAKRNGEIVFGSEIKSILQCPNIKRKPNLLALDSFLTYRFIPGPDTAFEGITKLLPGHILVFENNKIQIKKYWDIDLEPQEWSEQFCIKTLRKLLRESVKIRLMSEVPLGAYTSGGVDSGTVVGMMSKLVDKPIKTFTVGFGSEEHDELEYARVISERFKTDHRELVVEADAMKYLPKIVWQFDEPVADPAAIPTYLLSEYAKKYVTVVLTGEGADEQFAGYEQYKIMLLGDKYLRRVPRVLRKTLPSLAKIVPAPALNKFFKYSSALGEKGIGRFGDYLDSIDDKAKAYFAINGFFDEKEKRELYSIKMKDGNLLENVNREYFSDGKPLLNQMLNLDMKTLLPDNLLMKVDKMTMAFSVEARVPFLDHKFFEFTSGLPLRFKLNGMNDKYILRKAVQDLLPKEVYARKKARFFVPIDKWFEGEFGEIVAQFLDEKTVKKRGIFRHNYIKKMIGGYGKSKLFYSRQFWNLLNFELWYRIYIESDNIYKPKLGVDDLYG